MISTLGDKIKNQYSRNQDSQKGQREICADLCSAGPWTEGAHKLFQLSLSTLVTSVPAPLMGMTLLPIIMKPTTNPVNKDERDEDKDPESVKLPFLVVLHRGAETQSIFSMNRPFFPENGKASAKTVIMLGQWALQSEKALGLNSI